MDKSITGKVDSYNLTIIIVYDNYKYDERLKNARGFSCLIKVRDRSVLFDTGGDAPTLLGNMKKLRIDPKDIEIIVLSHTHGDHIGGLSGILDINPSVTVYILQSFPNSFKDKIKSYGAYVVSISNLTRIYDGIYTIGELGNRIKEQFLVIRAEKGLVVITGCAHPGIVNVIKKAKELTKEKVYLVIGGFHLLAANERDIKNILEGFRNLEVKKVAPCHCTGDKAIELFKEEYKDDFVRNGVGKIIDV